MKSKKDNFVIMLNFICKLLGYRIKAVKINHAEFVDQQISETFRDVNKLIAEQSILSEEQK